MAIRKCTWNRRGPDSGVRMMSRRSRWHCAPGGRGLLVAMGGGLLSLAALTGGEPNGRADRIRARGRQ